MFKERIKTHHSAMSDGKKYIVGVRKATEALVDVNTSNQRNSTIYIHVPFCNKICSFCNMRRSLQKPSSDYADLIVKEIEKYSVLEYIKTTVFDAVYFGGGTPTTLKTEDLVKILRALRENFVFTYDAEITIETTVTELDDDKIKALVDNGVNRFSVGVQTFDDEGRKKMGRIGSGEYAYNKLMKLKGYKGITVSMDLIYNYPGQTMKDLLKDLDKIDELELDGFSMYSLIDMKETAIDNAQNSENDIEMFFTISSIMKGRGYEFLELTKMVRSDKYRYIMNRHKGADTLPLGAGAGGSINGLAIMNPINLEEYKAGIEHFEERQGMQFVPDYKEVVRFKGDIQTTYLPENENLYLDREKYMNYLGKFMENEMIYKTGDRYRLTPKGIYWGNTISRELSGLIG